MNRETFIAGDIAILTRNCSCGCAQIGDEVTVLSGLAVRAFQGPNGPTVEDSYEILLPKGIATVRPRDLRKRRPPPQPDMLDSTEPLRVARWADSPWRPATVRA